MEVYVLTMKRQRGTHIYIKGVFSSKGDAEFAGKVEGTWRGGKYCAFVDPMILDAPTDAEEIKHYYDCLP